MVYSLLIKVKLAPYLSDNQVFKYRIKSDTLKVKDIIKYGGTKCESEKPKICTKTKRA
jgi:hypothetical protein